MSDARSEILARIRAVERTSLARVDRAYRRAGTLGRDECVELFCERARDYRADLRRVPGVADAVTAICAEYGVRRLGIPAGLPVDWLPHGPELVEDDGLAARELDELDGVLTGCTVAIAETGTIALTGAAGEGRRALTLVPDLHVCVVPEESIVELVPEAMTLLERHVAVGRSPLTLISGPSATSDIELSRVEGVHGPRKLIVLVTSDEVRRRS